MDDVTFDRLRRLHYLRSRIRDTSPVLAAQEEPRFERELGQIVEDHGRHQPTTEEGSRE